MNKYSITIICLIAMASPLSQATDSNDFFRFNPFSSTTDQCTKKSQDLSELNQLFNENTAPGETPDRPLKLMWLERELEIAKSNLAIIDGLKKINTEFKESVAKVVPDGNFAWTYNDAKKIDLLQEQTQNAASNYARFNTMANLLSGIQESLFDSGEPLVPPANLPANMTARASWLYKELYNRNKNKSSSIISKSGLSDYFSQSPPDELPMDNSILISKFLMAYSTSLFKSDGTIVPESELSSKMETYKRVLFDSIPSDAAARIASEDTGQLNTTVEYNRYKGCLAQDAYIARTAQACSNEKKAWISKVENVKNKFTDLKKRMIITSKDIDNYASLNINKISTLAESMEASQIAPQRSAKDDMIIRLKNMNFFRQKKIKMSLTSDKSTTDSKIDFYNSTIRQLLCSSSDCPSQDIFDQNLNINTENFKLYLSKIQEGQVSDQDLAKLEDFYRQEDLKLTAELNRIKSEPRNKVIMMSMDLLANDMVKNCRENNQVTMLSCQNNDLGNFRAITSKIKSLGGDVSNVMISLRGNPQDASFLNINTECTKMSPIPDDENKIIKEICSNAAKNYLATVQQKEDEVNDQKFLQQNRVTPNERGEVYVTNSRGRRVLAEGASVEHVDSGIGRALAQSFQEQMAGDNLVPGWMSLGVNYLNRQDRYDYFTWYGQQEKTYLYQQQQYWNNINQQCAFAQGMCVPMALNPATGAEFGF